MNRKILEENIYYYENVLENPKKLLEDIEIANSLVGETSISKWSEWISYQSDYSFGSQKMIKESVIDSSLPYYETEIDIYNRIKNSITKASYDYASMHNQMEIGVLAPLSISKYFVGKSMGPHVDSHDDDPLKTISVVVYLNDDYDGGDINFPEQRISVKPKAGSIVVFPSKKPYFHESKTIISGTKYMTPGFWSLVR
jgi:predicted 2-oxoglutarate/Fe(II)-dependent dioxygenase YbiX